MKIELNKTYITRDGRKVRVICTDAKGMPVVGLLSVNGYQEATVRYCSRGAYDTGDERYEDQEEPLDLIEEYSPWADVAVDTPVWVRFGTNPAWEPYHFAKYDKGEVLVFPRGMTSHTALDSGYFTCATEASLTRPCA